MIWRAKEGEVVWFPHLKVEHLPHPLNSGIKVHLRGRDIGIEAQGVVGAIPLKNGDTLQIVPKIGPVNFLRLLFRATGSRADLDREYENFVEYSIDDEKSVDSVVARSLYASVTELLHRSLKMTRVRKRRLGDFAAGPIDATSTALRLACRESAPVVYFASERSADTPENRVLGEALHKSWPLLDYENQTTFRHVLERWEKAVPKDVDIEDDLLVVEQGFARGIYGGARDYYRKPLMLAQVILGLHGVGLSDAAIFEGDALLLNSADIFERYVRNVIADEYAKTGYVVTKGGVRTSNLYTDGSYELQPDIVIAKEGETILIADAKYKAAASAADHYQLNTYLAINKIKRGLILAPGFDTTKILLKEYMTDNKTVVREAYLPVRDLAATEAFLRKVVDLAS